MKILRPSAAGPGQTPARPSRKEDGMATIIFITLMTIMMILVTAEARALSQLHREVKFLEQQQIKRLNHVSANVTATTKTESR